jgi:hypothetical protein
MYYSVAQPVTIPLCRVEEWGVIPVLENLCYGNAFLL